MFRPTCVAFRSILLLALLMFWGGRCVSARAAEERWDVVRLDLDIELCSNHGNLFGHQWLDRSGAPVLEATWTAGDGADGPAARVTTRVIGYSFGILISGKSPGIEAGQGDSTWRKYASETVNTIRTR